MKISSLSLAAALLTALCASSAGAQMTRLAMPKDYQLVWSDEFEVNGLPDPAKWVHDTHRNKQGWYNNELQYYSGPRAENAVVRDGKLVITTRLESMQSAADWGGQRYTSARLMTRGKSDWTYGFFEIRAKLPCGKGTWPAIWTLGSKGRWPDDGELDIMEHVGNDPDVVTSAIHTSAGNGGHAVWGGSPLPSACGEFNRYQMLWTPAEVIFGVNGFAHLRYPKLAGDGRAWPFDAPQYMLINVAVGGALGGAVDDKAFPVTMEVDYVRVYQAQPQPPGKADPRSK